MQPRSIIRFVVAVVITSLSACRPTHELRPRLILQADPVGDDFWLAAPYVAVVGIVGANNEGSPEPIFQGGPKTLQLVRFDANVENMIKGDLQNKAITFFFFTKLDQNPSYYLRPGRRYIVSLRDEGGVLRSWADAKQLRIEVLSGSHRQQDLPLDLGPAATIAYIRLTPGADCDLNAFAQTLGWPEISGVSPEYLYNRLKQLQLSSNPVLRESACLTAASMFWHRPRCLEQCLHSTDASIRRGAQNLFKDDVNLVGLIRHNPSALFPKAWTDYITEMFEIYTEDTRPEVRKAACASLRSFAPERRVEQCK